MVQPSFNTQKNPQKINIKCWYWPIFAFHSYVHCTQLRPHRPKTAAGRPAGICSLPTGVWNRLYRGNWLTNAMCLLAFKVTTNHSELRLWISFGKWTFLGLQSEQILDFNQHKFINKLLGFFFAFFEIFDLKTWVNLAK